MLRAELESGMIVELVQDCTCGLHQGPHWLHMNEIDRNLNQRLLSNGGRHATYAFAQAEVERLKQLEVEMQRRQIIRVIRSDEAPASRRAEGGGE